MKQIFLAFAVMAATLAPAQAQIGNTSASPVRFLAGMGVSGGGDKLVTARFTNGDSYDLKAGGIVYFTVGANYRISPDVSLQATANYHVDQANADNGDLEFQRFPLELIGYYQPHPQWRVGGGIRHTTGPKLSGSGAASRPDVKFDDTTGAVVEAEYFWNPHFGMKMRYVNETFKRRGISDIKGNHFGISGNYYF